MANVVGEVNGGVAGHHDHAWPMNGALSGGTSNFPQVLRLARECGATEDPVIRQRLADCYSKDQIIRYLGLPDPDRPEQGDVGSGDLGQQTRLLADGQGDRRS